MTRDDILRIAREAHRELLAFGKGMHVWHEDAYVGDVQAFCERFADLVAAAEREACAEICERLPETFRIVADEFDYKAKPPTAENYAAAIRARGEE